MTCDKWARGKREHRERAIGGNVLLMIFALILAATSALAYINGSNYHLTNPPIGSDTFSNGYNTQQNSASVFVSNMSSTTVNLNILIILIAGVLVILGVLFYLHGAMSHSHVNLNGHYK